MINVKNWIKLFVLLLISIAAPLILIHYSLVDMDGIIALGADFHYNMISMSAIIAGFLFTGISILISAIDKERVQRLWDNKYLDNLYRAAIIGMISNVATIIIGVTQLCIVRSESIELFLIKAEFVFLFIGVIFFVWSIKHLLSIIKRMHNQ